MRLVKVNDWVLNVDQLVAATFTRPDKLTLRMVHDQLEVEGDDAVKLFALLSNLAESSVGVDDGLFLAADLTKNNDEGGET